MTIFPISCGPCQQDGLFSRPLVFPILGLKAKAQAPYCVDCVRPLGVQFGTVFDALGSQAHALVAPLRCTIGAPSGALPMSSGEASPENLELTEKIRTILSDPAVGSFGFLVRFLVALLLYPGASIGMSPAPRHFSLWACLGPLPSAGWWVFMVPL